MAAHGSSIRTELTAAEAIEVARRAVLPAAPPGEQVRVFPVAHPESAVSGILTFADDQEVIVRRTDARASEVAVHFPRIGYRIEAGER